jgi:hypothetical protein
MEKRGNSIAWRILPQYETLSSTMRNYAAMQQSAISHREKNVF